MNRWKSYRYIGLFLLALASAGLMALPSVARADTEQTFDTLQIGTHTYHNVTVTTKTKNYIFILHSAGMTNLKVADLSPELRKQLGYVDESVQNHTNNASAWAKHTLAKLETPKVKGVETQVVNTWRNELAKAQAGLPPLTPRLLWIALAVGVVTYLFFCFSCSRLCQKTGQDPGILVWLPVFQLFPMLRAAGMSAWWLVLCLIPGINLIPQVVWSVRITSVRGKNMLLALLLFLPVFNLLAFLYLAFADGTAPRKQERRPVEIMTLETA